MLIPEIQIKKILYATDLSDSARYAFAYAVKLSQTHNAGLTILHVVEASPRMEEKILNFISEIQWNEIKKRHEETAHSILIGKRQGNVIIGAVLEQFCADVKEEIGQTAKFTVDEILIERGNPVDKIIEIANSRNCDLIVAGTHGESSLAKILIGNTAKKLIQRAEKPVLVVRLPRED